jgi:hypothetical protein
MPVALQCLKRSSLVTNGGSGMHGAVDSSLLSLLFHNCGSDLKRVFVRMSLFDISGKHDLVKWHFVRGVHWLLQELHFVVRYCFRYGN